MSYLFIASSPNLLDSKKLTLLEKYDNTRDHRRRQVKYLVKCVFLAAQIALAVCTGGTLSIAIILGMARQVVASDGV